MAQQGQVTKIYELRTLGYDDLGKQLDNINDKFEAIKKTKLSAQGKLAAASDVADLKKYGDELAKLQIQEQEYRTERQKLLTEQKAATIQRQAEINQRKQEQQSVEAAAGSYAELYKQYKELYALVKAAPKGSPVTFQGNTLQFDQAIAKLQQLAAAEQDFRRQFSRDSLLVGEYTSGIVQAFKKMGLDDLVGGQITKAQTHLQALNNEFNELKQELSEIKVTGNGSLEAVEQELIQNRKAAQQLQSQIGTLQTEFRGVGDVGNQITESLKNGFKSLGKNITSFALQFYGISTVLNKLYSGIQNTMSENAYLSDSFADLQRIMNATEAQTNAVVAALRKIDTRTSLKGLTDIAIIAARAGVAADDIAGVTKAIDQLNIVAGKELGNVEDATNSLVRLVNIFTTDGKVTEDSILSIGNGLISLANAGTASGDYLIDFSKRMAGVAKTAHVSIPAVLGLGAGFQELGTSAEIAGTTTSKILFEIGQNVPKFAAIAGKSVKDFSETLKSAPAEALIEVAAGLAKDKDSFQEVAEAFKAAGINRTRFAQAMSVLGANADYFRGKINLASAAVDNTNAIVDGATKKQETFAAVLAKVGKAFEKLGTSKTFQVTLMAIATTVAFLINNIGALIAILAIIAAGWAVQNTKLVVLNAQMLLYNARIILNYTALGILSAATAAYNLGLVILNGTLKLVTKGMKLLGVTTEISAGPIGVIITLVGTLGLVLASASKALGRNRDALTAHGQAMEVSRQVTQKVTDAIGDQVSKIQALEKVAKSNTISIDARRKALQDLIALSPEHLHGLTLENLYTKQGTDLVRDYIKALKDKATIQAKLDVRNEKQLEAQRLQTMQTSLETRIATGQAKSLDDLTDEEKELLSSIRKTLPFFTQLVTFKSSPKAALEAIKKQRQIITGELKISDDAIQSEYQKQAEDIAKGPISKGGKPQVDIAKMQTDLKALNDQINHFSGSNADFKKLIAERDKLQNQLDQLLEKGTFRSGKKSRLTGATQDALRDADALRDQQLADEKIRQTQGKVDEETYLRDILKINQDAIDKKLALIKGETVAEKSERAKLQLERIQDEQDTNQKIFSLRSQTLKNNMQLAVQAAQDEAKKVQDDPTASATAKAQAQLDADNKILQLQQNYAADLDKQEKLLGQQSLKNEKDADAAILDTRRKLHEDEIAIDQAALKDLQTKEATDIAKFKAAISAKRTVILNSNASDQRKDIALNTLGQEEDRGVLAREVKSMQEQLPIYQKLLAEKKITDEDYYNFIADLNKKQEDLHNSLTKTADLALQKVTSIKDLLANSLRDVLNIAPDSNTDQLLVQTISQTYQFATDAMNSYYDQKQARIAQDLQTQLTQLDAEKQAAEDHAQTQAEKNAIDAEYQKKEDALNRKAFEAKKKAQIAQAAVNLGIQLSNLAVIAFSPNPANIATLGAAGAIMYAIQAAVAVGQYALNVSRIKNAQYEQGGQPGDVPTRGGKFGGKPHSQGGTPFGYKGQTYEAEVDELSVIRTKNAPRNKVFTITGNHTQIASALNELGGGISFAGGASIRKMASGGHLGEVLQPPVFAPSMNNVIVQNNSSLEKKFDDLADKFENLANEQSKRIDRLEVVQVTGTVTKAQRKQTKQTSIGTLS